MKFEMEDVIEALRESNIGPDDMQTVVNNLDKLASELEKEKEEGKAPKIKRKYILLHPKDTNSYYISQVTEDYNLNDVVPNIQRSIGDYNQSAKKKKMEIKDNVQAIEFIPNKILKNNGLTIKTKLPCDIVEI
jgi:hypothetical protein